MSRGIARLMCLLFCLAILSSACGAETPSPSDEARADLEMLAGTIGARPVGTSRNRRALEHVSTRLHQDGFHVQIQEAEAVSPQRGLTTRVRNIIATRAGSLPDAIGLLSHYDSSPFAPGAADDALGVAVSLEAARQLAKGAGMRHTLMVLVTDGEEAGLMGAVALVGDREVSERLRAYVNLEALGPSGLPVLFESSDGLLVDGWRRAAPWPRGTSYATEIYKRLPNDTDFTILNARGFRGLNFATIGSSAVYHTARDTPDRVPRRTLRRSIENAVAIVRELDRGNLETGTSGDRVFFDVLNLVALAYSMSAARLVALAALLLALGAWIKLIVDARRRGQVAKVAMTAVWSLVSGVLIVSLMLGLTSTLRVVSGTLHPWYAHPDRFLVLLAFTVLGGVSLLLRAGSRLPQWLQGSADPRSVWSIALPVWAFLAAGLEVVAPAASYLWVIPLLAAGISLLLTPAGSPALLRFGSLVVLVVAGALWIRDVHVLHGFVVEQMARLPLVAPAFIYVVLPAAAAVMLVPPGLAAFHSETTAVRAWMHRATLVAASLCAVATFIAPAYSFDRPLRRFVRYVHDEAAGGATWEVGSLESDLGLEATDQTPHGWESVDASSAANGRWRGLRMPFEYRAPAEPTPFPGSIDVQAAAGEEIVDVHISVQAPEGSKVFFALPSAVPLQHPTLPGRIMRGRWVAAYEAPPATGVMLGFGLRAPDLDRLEDASVIIYVPWLTGSGWQGLPSWVPSERAVWAIEAVHARPVAGLIRRAAGVEAAPDRSRLR